jgi:hypothetical protein
MKKGIALVLCALVLNGCLEGDDEDDLFDDDDEVEEETVTSPTLIVENRGEETALLELWYTHDGVQSYREATLPAGDTFREEYPDLGTVKLMAGRLRDGLLLVHDTFEKADFRNGTLTLALRP